MRSCYSVFGPPPNKNALTLWDRMVKQNWRSAKTTCNSDGASETSAYPNTVSSSKGNSTRANSPNKLGVLESNQQHAGPESKTANPRLPRRPTIQLMGAINSMDLTEPAIFC
jgi:hypothetical protein